MKRKMLQTNFGISCVSFTPVKYFKTVFNPAQNKNVILLELCIGEDLFSIRSKQMAIVQQSLGCKV